MANIEKPGPDRKVEEEESEDQAEESTLLQTTGGGIFGDTEGAEDQTFSVPDPSLLLPLPQREKKNVDNRKGRRGSKSRTEDSSEEGSQVEDRRKDYHGRRKNSGTSQKNDKITGKIEAMEREMEEQRIKYEEQVEKMKEELKSKDLEMKSKKEENGNKELQKGTETSPPVMKGVVVVEVNETNEGQVSLTHNGMLVNKDGTLSRTPQSEAWAKNRDHQLVKRYETTPNMQEYLKSIPGHPSPTNLDLGWTHVGNWYDVPLDPNQDGAEGTKTRIGRIEPYIDLTGTIKEALSYGTDKGTLGPWYDLEEIKETFPKWKIPDPPRYYNNKAFNPQIRRDLLNNRQERKKYKTPPIDQSSNDIQGGRGRGRGRGSGGSGRGAYQPQYRGRGKSSYNEEYRDWDASQTAGPSTGPRRSHEDESWHEYKEWEKNQDRDSPGYFTRDYEDRKRARSPSPRGERYSRRDRSQDRQGSRRDYHEGRRDYRRDYSQSSSRRDYSPERQSRRDYSPRYRQESRGRRDYSPEESRRYSGQNR